MSHSPGPWTLERSRDYPCRFHITAADRAIMMIEHDPRRPAAEALANLRLCAAASLMLKALQACVEPLAPGEDCPLPADRYNQVCAAILAAGGE